GAAMAAQVLEEELQVLGIAGECASRSCHRRAGASPATSGPQGTVCCPRDPGRTHFFMSTTDPGNAPPARRAARLALGSCPDSWGVWFADDPLQTPWQRFLDELADVGYRWLELGPYGYLPTDPGQLTEELDKRGLRVSGQ